MGGDEKSRRNPFRAASPFPIPSPPFAASVVAPEPRNLRAGKNKSGGEFLPRLLLFSIPFLGEENGGGEGR